MDIPKNHPRWKSLMVREKLAELSKEGIVAVTGLIAHGRGEAFDYLLGERTIEESALAEKVAAAYLLMAKHPVISVNGNTAALCAKEIIDLAQLLKAKIEVNLFHRTEERVKKVCAYMEKMGANDILGRNPDAVLPRISSDRALCAREGIFKADVVLVPLEDGDRTEALVKSGKVVLAIDLNPLSRTSRAATVTIVDELTRAIPNIHHFAAELKGDVAACRDLISRFENRQNLKKIIQAICRYLNSQF